MTGARKSTAEKYLRDSQHNLQRAINQYYVDNQGNDEDISFQSDNSQLTEPLKNLFDKYMDPADASVTDIDGTIRYLGDMEIEPDELASLTLLYLLNSRSMGIFLRQEFVNTWKKLSLTTPEDMAPYVREQTLHWLSRDLEFDKVYKFTYGFLLEQDGQKLLPYDLCIDYWRLLLVYGKYKENEPLVERLEQWCTFIEAEQQRGISRDTWDMFNLFVREIMLPDPEEMKEYDDMAAWPSVIDEYIEYLRENKLIKESMHT